ncbi:GTP-binding protein [Vagococcus salmoninarum]|uniref:GTP-binding protein n=3 Tax=Vagococcus salmoninarum TaxID=2739 RepID=UPI00187E6F5A|nr:GTP-binding protein [Vagococcus salmoninarum]MBE9389943.1 GTP-binding protein [Vagococcus salmoninarum]
MKKIINIGIFAHVDAGKTSLTEALYDYTHKHYQKGSIKNGTTMTDSLELEKERGITIKTAALSFNWQTIKINLLDTPGHIDFFAEVVRTLETIDLAVLVVASNDLLQPQTRKLFSYLTTASIPTIIFLNKVDLQTAQVAAVTEEIREKMTQNLIPYAKLNQQPIQDLLIENDDKLLEHYLAGEPLTAKDLNDEFFKQFLSRKIFPLIEGSAITGLGISMLLDIFAQSSNYLFKSSEELCAYVYKIEFANRKKQTYWKLVSGTLTKNTSVILNGNQAIKLSNLFSLEENLFTPAQMIIENDIFMIPNDSVFKIGDYIGLPVKSNIQLAPSNLKLVFSIADTERLLLLALLEELNQEDPLLNLTIDPETKEISICIFGNVQKEVIEETLRRSYPFESLTLLPPTIIYQEIPQKTGRGEIVMQEPINPYWATMTIEIQPNNGHGIQFSSRVTTGYLKQSFQHAVYQGIQQSVTEGLYGYPLIDMDIILVDAEFFSPVSTPSEFRKLAPYALYKALLDANTFVVEPLVNIELFIKKDDTGRAVAELGKLEAKIEEIQELKSEVAIKAKLLHSNFLTFENQLNEWFKGTAYLKNSFEGYEKTSDNTTYSQGNIDRIKAMLIKEIKQLNY